MSSPSVAVEDGSFRSEPALVLRSGELCVTFLPQLGMTGVSLRHRDAEHLALPGGLAKLRAGATMGLPLLAPWANRLASRRYRASGVDVDLNGLEVHEDANGLPMHGLLVGAPGWRIGRRSARGGRRVLGAAIDVDAAAFPFPHRVELSIALQDDRLTVDTTVVPTGTRNVPISFGWHPYLRVPSAPRRAWRLHLPARQHLALDGRGIPTGESCAERAEAMPIGRRTFDDLYRFERVRRLAISSDDGRSISLQCDGGYRYAQVWVPAGRPYVSLEPMTSATNSLVAGTAGVVEPGDAYRARFSLVIDAGA